MSISVRFAPSPTGNLHVGGLRTALYNYLYAKGQNGRIVLRIEDTDQSRKVDGAVKQLMSVFDIMKLEFDESPKHEGDCGPYFQSQRLDIYKKYIEQLVDKGLAYPCFCSSDRLNALRKKNQKLKLATQYDRHCLSLTKDQIREKGSTASHVIRLKVPHSKPIIFNDIIRNKITFNAEEIDDQILLKSDGFPTYHLASVIDDYHMGITHVIRGEEWLSSTPKHILLYNAFGWDVPKFAHVPLLLNPDKSKLSKRQGDVAVEDYLKKGTLPEALINFVALLGWNPGDNREIFSLDELISEFSLERIHMSGAIFNQEKLSWMNSQYLKNLPLQEVIEYAKPFITLDISTDDEKFNQVIDFARNRISYLTELDDEIKYFYALNLNEHSDRNILNNSASQLLFKFWVNELSKSDKWTPVLFKDLISKTNDELNIKGKDLFFPIRLAIYGECKGPDIPTIYNILGHNEFIARFNSVIKG
ncbi:glutamate--tRNA ligase [Candidatus Marinimicrobia bacterium]|nr:glutamate--tRNA ligase [Candidatus Neomarinimicrobiota bacterium]